MSRLPVVSGDTGAWGTILNDFLSQGISTDGTLKSARVINVAAAPYSVSPTNTATANATAITQAFTDAALIGGAVYLPGNASMYPCNPLTLPRAPIAFFGDGPTASVLLQPQGAGSSPMLSGNAAGVPASGPFARASSSAAQMYDTNLTIIRDLGFNAYPNFSGLSKGIMVPTQSGTRAQFLIDRCSVYAPGGTGIELVNAGAIWGSFIRDCCVYGCGGAGFVLGSDMLVSGCVAANTGLEGFSTTNGTSLQIDHCKAYGCGWDTAARGIGYYLKTGNAGVCVTNCDAQDCVAEGLVIETAGKNVSVNGFISDSCSANSAGTYAGMRITDSQNVRVVGYVATDRNYGGTAHQIHALKITNPNSTNAGITVELTQMGIDEGNGMPTLSDPVDSTSDLRGAYVIVGASDGGQSDVTVAAGVVGALDPYASRTKQIPVAANITSVPAPSNRHRGCKLTLQFNASGSFNVTGGWNAVYKGTALIPTTGGASGKFMVCEFEYDGTNWCLMNAPSWR